MHPTMEDIARECGVSMMTVSRVLSGQDCVRAATRDKVMRAAERLHYEVNALAQNFAQKRSGFIGIALPFRGLIGTYYFGEIFKGLQRILGDKAWDFALFDTLSSSFDDGGKIERLYRSRKVEGLFVVAPNADDAFLDTFTDLRIPLIVVGKRVTNPSICSVACDDYRGVELLCSHLYSLGHRRIAFVGGPESYSVAQWRESAYTDFCRKRKLELTSSFVYRGDYTMRSGRAAGFSLLRSEGRPTAIVAANDMMAFGVIESAHELNVDVPGDVSVGGFDDLPTAAESFPSVTTVRQPVLEMAEQSAKLLLNALSSGRPPQGQRTVPVSLVTRQSTGPAPAASRRRQNSPKK
jgi:DNA-binding LacI/PurR family transcriptional regulator